MTNLQPEGFTWPDPDAFYVDLVTVPDPETVKYRGHLDLATTSAAHQAELVARLKELGATPADVPCTATTTTTPTWWTPTSKVERYPPA